MARSRLTMAFMVSLCMPYFATAHGVELDSWRILVNPTVVSPSKTSAKTIATSPTPTVKVRSFFVPENPEQFELIGESISTTGLLGAGDATVIKFVADGGAFEMVSAPSGSYALLASARAFVQKSPKWLRNDLVAVLTTLTPERQAEVISGVGNVEPPILDEVAFLVAHIPTSTLADTTFRPGFLVDHAEMVYQADAMLDYVELVEYDDHDGDGAWTTARYLVTKDGAKTSFELARDDYYWWVLHPALDRETIGDIDPGTGKVAVPPQGTNFRKYLMYPESFARQYTSHYIFDDPEYFEWEAGLEDVLEDTCQGWGPSSRGAIVEFGALNLTTDSRGRPTTIEFKIKPKGIVLATTLRVEDAWALGRSNLLQTMLRYGPGNVVHHKNEHAVVVMERSPFGHERVIEDLLDSYEIDYEVVGTDFLTTGDLTNVRKLIIPSDQPKAVYQALADNRARLEEWVSGAWRILEIHLAVDSTEDAWAELVMPGGFSVTDLDGTGDDTVFLGGHPALSEVMANTSALFDDATEKNLSGARLLGADTFAMDKVGWFSSQNMFDSVADWKEKHGFLRPERAVQAARVIHNHFGNCGELQDVVTATGKTMLIPMANTSNSAEDHVWSEFMLDGTWHPIALDWSDGDTFIDNPGISFGKKWGGGKNISLVTSDRGDGASINRTTLYADTGTLRVNVTDAADNPVAGATIMVVTESYYLDGDSYPLMIAHWQVTGADGGADIALGINDEADVAVDCADLNKRCNNYYIKVYSDLGAWPAESGMVAIAVSAEEATRDFSKVVTVKLDQEWTARTPVGEVSAPATNPDRAVRVRINNLSAKSCGDIPGYVHYCDSVGHGSVAVAVLDEEQYQDFADGKEFKATAWFTDLEPDGDLIFEAPTDGVWYLAVVQAGTPGHRQLFSADWSLTQRIEAPDETPDDIMTEGPSDVFEPFDFVADSMPEQIDGDVWDATGQDAPCTGGVGCSSNPVNNSAKAWPFLLMTALGLAVLAWFRRYA